MNRRDLALLVALCCPLGALSRAHADVVCPDSSYVTVSFTKTLSGSYATGQPYNVVTISPSGDGETFADNGITIRAFLKNCQGQPLVGVPASDVVLVNPTGYFCTCPGGNVADGPTDQNGETTFTGTIRGGGCADGLRVVAQSVQIGIAPVKINSPDVISSGGPCQIDSHDKIVVPVGAEVGIGTSYTICKDFNEDGRIDISDLVYMGYFSLARCQP